MYGSNYFWVLKGRFQSVLLDLKVNTKFKWKTFSIEQENCAALKISLPLMTGAAGHHTLFFFNEYCKMLQITQKKYKNVWGSVSRKQDLR